MFWISLFMALAGVAVSATAFVLMVDYPKLTGMPFNDAYPMSVLLATLIAGVGLAAVLSSTAILLSTGYWRFSLRGLLLMVLVCAITFAAWRAAVRPWMTDRGVRFIAPTRLVVGPLIPPYQEWVGSSGMLYYQKSFSIGRTSFPEELVIVAIWLVAVILWPGRSASGKSSLPPEAA